MRSQTHGITPPDPVLVARKHLVTEAELGIFGFITNHQRQFAWGSWNKASVIGFGTTVADCLIEIRRLGPVLYGGTNRRWLRFDIDPDTTPRWYHFRLIDRFGRFGKKTISDFAAIPSEVVAYQLLEQLFSDLQARCPDQLFQVQGVFAETGKFLEMVEDCLSQSPRR